MLRWMWVSVTSKKNREIRELFRVEKTSLKIPRKVITDGSLVLKMLQKQHQRSTNKETDKQHKNIMPTAPFKSGR